MSPDELGYDPTSQTLTVTPRRCVLKRLLLFAAGLGSFILSPRFSPTAPGNTQADEDYYPRPSYLPPGYRFAAEPKSAMAPGGFGGKTEKVLSYWNIAAGQRLGPGAGEIRIWMSKDPEHGFGPENVRQPTQYFRLKSKSGGDVEARYWDGLYAWDEINGTFVDPLVGSRYRWDTTYTHSIAFKLLGFHIGIKGHRKPGVSLDELIKIASSFE